MSVTISDLVYWSTIYPDSGMPTHWLIGKVHEITGISPNRVCVITVLKSSKSIIETGRYFSDRYFSSMFELLVDIRENELVVINENEALIIALTHHH